MKWKGHVNGKEKEITGKIEIPNLSEEHNDMKDVDVDITISNGKGSPEGEILKDMMRKGTGAKMIRTKLQEYVDALKKEYSEGLILPKKDEAAKSSGPKVLNNSSTWNIHSLKKSIDIYLWTNENLWKKLCIYLKRFIVF